MKFRKQSRGILYKRVGGEVLLLISHVSLFINNKFTNYIFYLLADHYVAL